ncbi:MAG: hypothetical protein ACRBHB_17220 [Arenicella sp.]
MTIPANPSPDSSDSTEEIESFRLERLKYVLSQQKFLNEHSHKYVATFQTTVTAIIVAAVAVFMSWRSLSISAEIAKSALRALELLLITVGGFLVLVIITNVASWWDYRKEESKLMNEVIGDGFRDPPSVKGVWRWFETWLLALVLVLVGGAVYYFETSVIPLIK